MLNLTRGEGLLPRKIGSKEKNELTDRNLVKKALIDVKLERHYFKINSEMCSVHEGGAEGVSEAGCERKEKMKRINKNHARTHTDGQVHIIMSRAVLITGVSMVQ